MNKQTVTNCFRKQIQNMDPSLLSWSQHPLTCTQRFEEDTKIQIIRISWISQYTEVKSEKILKKSKDLQGFQGFHQYILKYPQNMNHTMYIYTGLQNDTHQRCKLTSDMNEPNKYRPPLSSKTKKYTTCIISDSQHIY